jgi:DNA-binding transcriptional ArsR family regulator
MINLDHIFAALARPKRRAIVARLVRGDATVSELAEPFGVTLLALSRHLKVLEDAALISIEQQGKHRRCRLSREALTSAKGFAFVGSQYHLEITGQDYYLDLLFYHLRLRCFVLIELKIEDFKPEFAGKMNFYLSAVDDQLQHKGDHHWHYSLQGPQGGDCRICFERLDQTDARRTVPHFPRAARSATGRSSDRRRRRARIPVDVHREASIFSGANRLDARWTGRVLQQPVHPLCHEAAAAPAADRQQALVRSRRNPLRCQSIARQQYDPRPPNHLLRRVSVPNQPLQSFAIRRADPNLLDFPHRRRLAGSRRFVNRLSATEHWYRT